MLRRAFIAISLLWWSGTALAADIVDATGRNVQVPEHIERVLPAGPPAAILLAVLAPDLMLGWTSPVSDEARACLSPEAATLPQVPRLTGRDDVIAQGGCTEARSDRRLRHRLAALCGSCSRDTAAHRHAHIAAGRIADGNPARVPPARRHSAPGGSRGNAWRSSPRRCWRCRSAGLAHPRVLYARGADGLTVVAPGTDLARHLQPPRLAGGRAAGQGTFRTSSIDDIRALDPDIVVFSDPAMRATLDHPDHGDRCARCAMAMRSWHLPCRSAGSRNRRRSTGCSAWRG